MITIFWWGNWTRRRILDSVNPTKLPEKDLKKTQERPESERRRLSALDNPSPWQTDIVTPSLFCQCMSWFFYPLNIPEHNNIFLKLQPNNSNENDIWYYYSCLGVSWLILCWQFLKTSPSQTTKAVYVCSKINPAQLKLIAHKTMTMKDRDKKPWGPWINYWRLHINQLFCQQDTIF